MTEQLSDIIKKERQEELILFLKSLAPDQKKQLSPAIKKLSKQYNEFIQRGNGSYSARGTAKQQKMIMTAGFVCLNRAEYEKSFFASWILDRPVLEKILDWYCPDWFSDFVNKLANEEYLYHAVNYELVIELSDKGFLQPGKELIAKVLPHVIFENKDQAFLFKPENLLKHTITLQEHIWYLFEVETDLHYSNRWLQFGQGVEKEKIGWITTFKQYASEGKISRSRLLQESILASNRNFNKVLSGWFCDLFMALEPTAAEILLLQKELFSVLNSAHSKPVNTALQCVKKVIGEREFDAAVFLDNGPLLLTSSTKNNVSTTLGILEKLAKKNKVFQLPVCNMIIQTFIHADEDLQLRAAKVIASYSDQLDDSFSEALQPYQSSLMSSAKKLLHQFYSSTPDVYEIEQATESSLEPIEIADELEEILLPESIDDLVFLTSQAFDNNQSWHFDVLPAAIVKWQSQLKGENISKLEPALQRALKMTKGQMRTGQGNLDHMLAIFFIDVCIYLCRKFPKDAIALQMLFRSFDQVEGTTVAQWMSIDESTSYMDGWDNIYHDPFFIPHKQLLIAALQKIRTQESLPLLSTPTHEPAWILPEVLVRRVMEYQKNNKIVFNIDFQVAVSRCLLTDTENAVALTEENLSGEYKNLLLFLFGKHATPQAPFNDPSVWMCCSLARKEKKTYAVFEKFASYKNPFEFYTGQYPWQSIDEEYEIDRYDYQKQRSFKEKARRKILQIKVNKKGPVESAGLKRFFSSILQKSKEEPPVIYDHFTIKAQWLHIPYDLKRVLLLIPNNPEPFLAEIIKHCLQYPTFWSEDDKRTVIASLQTLHEIWLDFGEMAYLFLGTCMIASDKTVANIAGEIWVKAVGNGNMNNVLLGKIIGNHESIEFAPLKRFTDLINQSLFKISSLHNQSLTSLIENILVELPDTPIKNLKKLLEIYNELLEVSNSTINNKKLQARLDCWKQNATVYKIATKLSELNR